MKKLVMFLAITLCFVFPIVAKADPNNLNFDRKGSINIEITDPYTKKGVRDIKFNIYYVGTINEKDNNVECILTKDFINSGVIINDIKDNKTPQMAKALNDYAVKEKISSDIIVTNQTGNVVYEAGKLGMYLVVPDKMAKNSIYCDMNPILIPVPYSVGNGSGWIYDVQFMPKIEHKKEEVKKPINPKEKDPKLPQTGLLQWPIPVLAVTGIALFCLGWSKAFLNKKHEK